MQKFVLLIVVLYSIFSSLTVERATAQEFNPCYNSPCTEEWHHVSNAFPFHGLLGIKYKIHWRNCGGQIECVFEIEDMTSADYFAIGSNYENDFKEARETAEFLALKLLLNELFSANIPIPDCPAERPFIKFYTARCGVWVKCSFPISNEPESCDDCWVGEHPEPYSHNGKSYVDIYKWQPCGTICCQKEFKICKGYDANLGYSRLFINDVTRGPAPGASCSEQGTCHDWKTGIEIQCQDGCQSFGN